MFPEGVVGQSKRQSWPTVLQDSHRRQTRGVSSRPRGALPSGSFASSVIYVCTGMIRSIHPGELRTRTKKHPVGPSGKEMRAGTREAEPSGIGQAFMLLRISVSFLLSCFGGHGLPVRMAEMDLNGRLHRSPKVSLPGGKATLCEGLAAKEYRERLVCGPSSARCLAARKTETFGVLRGSLMGCR